MFRTETYRIRATIALIVMLVFFNNPSPLNLPFGLMSREGQQAAAAQVAKQQAKVEYQKLRVTLSRDAVTILGLEHRPERMYSGLTAKQSGALVEIHKAFGVKHFKDAVRIAYCESRLDPAAVNRANRNSTVDRGLFQLNDGGTMQRLGVTARGAFDPTINAQAARVLFEDRGWQPWSCQYVYKILDKYKAKETKAAKAAAVKSKRS